MAKVNKKSSLAKRNIKKFMENKMAVLGLAILAVILFMCIFAPLLTPYDPNLIDPTIRELPCSAEHPLGTDRVGRDVFARILYGGRMSITIGVVCALGSTLVGTALGCIAGFYGGKVDRALVTFQEFFSIFPQTLLILLCISFLGKSTFNLFFIFIVTSWPGLMRVVRARIMSLKQEPFVESCRANGISSFSIMFHHMLPNTMGPVIVYTMLNIPGFILSEAGLSFIGMGVPDNVVTWGNIINAARRIDIIQNMPMLWLGPGIAICLFTLSMNLFGNGLRDVLDPSAQ